MGSKLQVPPCRMYGSYVCGEGGEYESLTLDCPLFLHARIVLEVHLLLSAWRYPNS